MAGDRSGNMQSGSHGRGASSGQQTGGSLYERAGSAVGGMTETASDLWDDVYDQGEEYYREGRRAVGRIRAIAGPVGPAGRPSYLTFVRVTNRPRLPAD